VNFREIKTAEEFVQTYPVMRQDLDGEAHAQEAAKRFLEATQYGYRQFALYDNGQVVAVVGINKTYNPNYKTPAFDVTNVVVGTKYRNKGVGSKLMDCCKDLARAEGVDCVRLCVYPENYKAHAFYQKNGFKHTANFMFHALDDVAQSQNQK
jgi:ribosomal protein S18 acetylase RimI-like enzyme